MGDTFSILWKIAVLTGSFIGWGFLAARLLGVPARFLPFEFGIVGFAAAYVAASLAALIVPLNDAASLAFLAIGVCGLVAFVIQRRPRLELWFVFVVAFALLVAAGTVRTPMNYDAGLYYLQHIQYLKSEAAPLGIANIHGRLGFNTSWFILSALSSTPLFGRDGLFLLNAVAAVIFIGAWLHYAVESWRAKSYWTSATYAAFVVLMFLWNANEVLFSWFGLSPSSDIPAAFTGVYAVFAFVALAERLYARAEGEGEDDTGRFVFLLLSSVALALTLKLSQAPLPILAVLLIWPLRINRGTRPFRLAAVFSATLLGCWILHGLMQSGCLAYPAGASCLGFLPWSVPAERAQIWIDVNRAWARAPGAPLDVALQGWGWLALWRQRMLPAREFVWSLAAAWAVLGALALAVTSLVRRGRTPENSRLSLWSAGGVTLVGLVYWSTAAPDPRFAIGFLIALGGITVLLASASIGAWEPTDRECQRLGIGFACLFTLLFAVEWRGLVAEGKGGARCSWRNLPAPRFRQVTTGGGVTVKVPTVGDQCWELEAPCAPFPDPALARTRLLGHTAYIRLASGSLKEQPVQPSTTTPSASGSGVSFAPNVWGAEIAARGGATYQVRWLQQKTEFRIEHRGAPRRVRLTLTLATHEEPRHVALLHNGKPLAETYEIRNEFWFQGAQTVSFTATLGDANVFVLSTPNAMSPLPGNRMVALLLVGDIEVNDAP